MLKYFLMSGYLRVDCRYRNRYPINMPVKVLGSRASGDSHLLAMQCAANVNISRTASVRMVFRRFLSSSNDNIFLAITSCFIFSLSNVTVQGTRHLVEGTLEPIVGIFVMVLNECLISYAKPLRSHLHLGTKEQREIEGYGNSATLNSRRKTHRISEISRRYIPIQSI